MKVRVVAWWVIRQESKKLFGKPSARRARAVCAPPAPRLLRCPLVSRGAAFTWEKPDRRGGEVLTQEMLNTREVDPGSGCPHRGHSHPEPPQEAGLRGSPGLSPEGRQSRLSAVPAARLPRPRSARPELLPRDAPLRAVPPPPASPQACLSRGPPARLAPATGGMLPRIAAEPLRT